MVTIYVFNKLSVSPFVIKCKPDFRWSGLTIYCNRNFAAEVGAKYRKPVLKKSFIRAKVF